MLHVRTAYASPHAYGHCIDHGSRLPRAGVHSEFYVLGHATRPAVQPALVKSIVTISGLT